MFEPIDEREMERLRRWDPSAIERLFKTYAHPLYSFIYYRVGKDAGLGAELVQETFLSAISEIGRYDPKRGSMYAWLTYLSRNHIRKTLRERSREKSYEQLWEQMNAELLGVFERIATEPLPDEVLSRTETSALVKITLTKIPANYRNILQAHYYRKESISQIAANLGVSEAAVKGLLQRAKKTFSDAFTRVDETYSGPDVLKGMSDG